MRMNLSVSLLLFFCFCSLPLNIHAAHNNERKIYIVYMGEAHPEDRTPMADVHHNLLLGAIGDRKLARESKIHSYEGSFNAFAARLLPREADWLSQQKSVVSVFLNRRLQLHTTRSWDFLGFTQKVERNHQVESNIIVGLLDTGIWPQSPSFNDEGFGPPPPKWKGKCETGVNFTGCNNKVIGARYFDLGEHRDPDEPTTPADFEGHGTHTASTVAGAVVNGANLFGLAKGTARGGVPSARIASYKVCWSGGCDVVDLLAGFEAAIADGVDVLSVSIGGPATDFFRDPIAIGSFHAMRRGILTACAGGNSGPQLYTVQNPAPWIMTVAASSTDRQFQSALRLGDGTTFHGLSVNTFTPKKKMYPLIAGALARDSGAGPFVNASACEQGSLCEDKIKGKIVLCLGTWGQDSVIKKLGGVGTIFADNVLADTAFSFLIPATSVNISQGRKIFAYINSTQEKATAVIEKTVIVNATGPFIVSFSSRGPATISHHILKPDIAAPGLDILAAYSPMVSMTETVEDKRFVNFNIMSGTSMACPHAAAAAAYIKTLRPNWSPAAIKSALMTTAKPMKIEPTYAELAAGAGMVDPIRALNPGLIYDLDVDSYISFLCKEGLNITAIRKIAGNDTKDCRSFPHARGSDGLNYPSMHLQLEKANSSSISAVFHRTVTYVGQNQTVFKATVTSPHQLSVTVDPKTLSFTKQYEKRTFEVKLNGKFVGKDSLFISASMEWSDSNHNVKSPILVYRLPE